MLKTSRDRKGWDHFAAMIVQVDKNDKARSYCSVCGYASDSWFKTACDSCGREFNDHLLQFDSRDDQKVLEQPDGWSSINNSFPSKDSTDTGETN